MQAHRPRHATRRTSHGAIFASLEDLPAGITNHAPVNYQV
jgi:hypothetical protein